MIRFSLTAEEIAFIAEPMKALVERARQQEQAHMMPTHEEMDAILAAEDEYERGITAHLHHHLKGKTLVMHWWGSLVAYPSS